MGHRYKQSWDMDDDDAHRSGMTPEGVREMRSRRKRNRKAVKSHRKFNAWVERDRARRVEHAGEAQFHKVIKQDKNNTSEGGHTS